MSCAVWTFVSVYAITHNKPDAWYVTWAFRLMFVFLPLSAFLAWREQYQTVEAQNAVIKSYEDRATDLTVVSHIAYDGSVLVGTAPPEESSAMEIVRWKKQAEDWCAFSRGQLFGISPIAANKFTHNRQSPAQDYYGVNRAIRGELSLLSERLENLTDIMERADIYLTRVRQGEIVIPRPRGPAT